MYAIRSYYGSNRMIACDHDNFDPCCVAFCNSFSGFRTRRVHNSDETKENEVSGILFLGVCLPEGKGNYPFSLFCQLQVPVKKLFLAGFIQFSDFS